MSTPDLYCRFAYHPPKDDAAVKAHGQVRYEVGDTARVLDELLPDGREKALAITKLEEAMMWANAAIARNGSKAEAPSDSRASASPHAEWKARNTKPDPRVPEVGDRVKIIADEFRGSLGTVARIRALPSFPFEVSVDADGGLDHCYGADELEVVERQLRVGDLVIVTSGVLHAIWRGHMGTVEAVDVGRSLPIRVRFEQGGTTVSSVTFRRDELSSAL